MREINIVGHEGESGFERDMFDHLYHGVKLNEYSYDDDPSKIDRPVLEYSHMGFGIPDEVANFAEKLPNGYLIYHKSNEFPYQQYPQFIQQKANLYKVRDTKNYFSCLSLLEFFVGMHPTLLQPQLP